MVKTSYHMKDFLEPKSDMHLETYRTVKKIEALRSGKPKHQTH